MARLTKVEMVKDIFFEATNGKRSVDNYVAGMSIIETIAANNYGWAIKDWWNMVNEGASAKEVLRKMYKQTMCNVSGVSGWSNRCTYLSQDYHKFF